MLLPNGSAIHNDIIDAFNKAYDANQEHIADEVKFWNFVDADFYMDLITFYSHDYIYECWDVLVEEANWLYKGVVA